MVLSMKVEKFNVNEILDNYLNQKFWGKKWTLFEYDGFVATLFMDCIYVASRRVSVEIKVEKDGKWKRGWVWFSLDTENQNELVNNRQIYGKVVDLLLEWEESNLIPYTDEYKIALEVGKQHREKIRLLAVSLLDSLGIKHEEVREAYIKETIIQNAEYFTGDVEYNKKYLLIGYVILTYLLYVGYESKYNYVKEEIAIRDKDKLNRIMEKIQELKEKIENDEIEVKFEEIGSEASEIPN